MTRTIKDVLKALEAKKCEPSQEGSQWRAKCPAHDDTNPSLTVKPGSNGEVLVRCWSQKCSYQSILEALGLWVEENVRSQRPRDLKGKQAKTYPTLDSAITAATRSTRGQHAGTWTYHHVDGDVAFYVCRFNLTDGSKQFRPVHNNGAGFVLADPAGLLPLFRLPELPQHDRIYVVEGEKCVEALASIGLIATTSAHGSKSASKSDWTRLAGKDVVILPDADDAGVAYAESAATILGELHDSTPTRIVNLPGLRPNSGDDVAEFIAERRVDGKDDAAIRKEIEDLVEHAPLWVACKDDSGPVLLCLADVEPRCVSWLWPQRMALGRCTLLVGRPGEGKSFFDHRYGSARINRTQSRYSMPAR